MSPVQRIETWNTMGYSYFIRIFKIDNPECNPNPKLNPTKDKHDLSPYDSDPQSAANNKYLGGYPPSAFSTAEENMPPQTEKVDYQSEFTNFFNTIEIEYPEGNKEHLLQSQFEMNM